MFPISKANNTEIHKGPSADCGSPIRAARQGLQYVASGSLQINAAADFGRHRRSCRWRRQTVAIVANSFREFPSRILKSTRSRIRPTFKSPLANPEQQPAQLQALRDSVAT